MELNDYKNDLAMCKMMLILMTVLTSVGCIYIVKSSFDEAEEQRNEIFVADSQNTLLLALSKDMSTNRGNEARAVVNKMHTHLLYMTPTASAIEGGIAKACDLSDVSVRQYCDKLKESGWYNKMMAEGISTEFVSDSIVLYESDRQGYDFFVRLYGKTSTISSDYIEFKRIETSCFVKEQSRVIDNPSGYRCCHFNVEKSETIKKFRREKKVYAQDSTCVDN